MGHFGLAHWGIPIVWLTEGSQHTTEVYSIPRGQEKHELVKQKWQERDSRQREEHI